MLSAGPIAFMFSFTPFYAQMGMQFWLLIGAFEGLAQARNTRRAWLTGPRPAFCSRLDLPRIEPGRSHA